MSWYALTYILLTIPLQSGRMSSGKEHHYRWYGFAGSVSSLNGIVHTILYIFTRDEILTSTFDIPASSPRSRNFSDSSSVFTHPKPGDNGGQANPTRPSRSFSKRGNTTLDVNGNIHGAPHELSDISPNSPSSKRNAKESSRELSPGHQDHDPWESQGRPISDIGNGKPVQVWHAI
jgi:hypothetical protein